jgi:hypothetical protein
MFISSFFDERCLFWWSRHNPPGYANFTIFDFPSQQVISTEFSHSFWALCQREIIFTSRGCYHPHTPGFWECWLDLLCVTFLSPNKKVTKEIGIGEVADREAYRSCFYSPTLLPRLRAALPYVPLLAPIEALIVVAVKKETLPRKPS